MLQHVHFFVIVFCTQEISFVLDQVFSIIKVRKVPFHLKKLGNHIFVRLSVGPQILAGHLSADVSVVVR